MQNNFDRIAEPEDILRCPYCDALVWHSENCGRDPQTGNPLYTICCQQGRVKLPPVRQPPPVLEKLQDESSFRNNIRVYNSILAFTSIGAKIDHTVTSGSGPPTFRIQGQNYHRIGSLIPTSGNPPKFLQLYIVDTSNEVSNRIQSLQRTPSSGPLQEGIVKQLIDMLDSSNHLCQIFRKARDQYETAGAKEFTIRLVANQGKGRQYDMPNTNEVAGLIVGDLSTTTGYKDVILQYQSNHLQEIRDDHPLYMSLQYPLLFPYGEYGFHTEIPYVVAEGRQRKKSFISIREYYAYQIQTRQKEGKTIIKSGRLLHQYVVDAYF